MLNREVLEHTKSIFDCAVNAAVPTPAAFVNLSQKIGVDPDDGIAVIGVGKASLPMAWGVCAHHRVIDGLITVPPKYLSAESAHRFHLNNVEVVEGDHPFPAEKSRSAAAAVKEKIGSLDIHCPVVVLISGGGSSLWGCPHPSLTEAKYYSIIRRLASSAMPIGEMNIIRSHLGDLSGGGLRELIGDRPNVTYVLSDVPEDNMSMVSSGPMSPPAKSQSKRCVEILTQLGYKSHHVPKKHGGSTKLIKIGDNDTAINGAREKARDLGYSVLLRPDSISGEARNCAASIVREISSQTSGTCIVYGGESTVTVTGDGKGGRSQELALAAAIQLNTGQIQATVLSAGTDGIDGLTAAAGAVVDETTVASGIGRNKNANDYLTRNDSFHFFEGTGNHLITGPTQTNVMDLVIAIRREDIT